MNPDPLHQHPQREMLAYLAGLIDSDGYISIMAPHTTRRSPIMFGSVGLKQIGKTGPELLQKAFGGCVFQEKASTPGGKPLWGWRVTFRQAENCLRQLVPFLRIKKAQAETVIEFSEAKAAHALQFRNKPLSPEVVNSRQDFRRRVRQLNDTIKRDAYSSFSIEARMSRTDLPGLPNIN